MLKDGELKQFINLLHHLRKFAESYPDSNCATAVAQIPWGHNIALLEKVDSIEKRLWSAQ